MDIREVRPEDAGQIVTIYNHYVAHTTITFEESPTSVADMVQRIEKVQRLNMPWLVAEMAGTVVGYAYASPYHTRSAYRFTVESSIYVSANTAGRGIGSRLYRALIERLQSGGIRHIIGVVALPNERSTALHEKLGFRKVGEMNDIGLKFGRSISVSYWQFELNEDACTRT